MTKIQLPPTRLLAALVRQYRRRRASVVNGELAWFREQATFTDALDRAALGRIRGEKRHPHQYRVLLKALPLAHDALRRARERLAACRDFDRLHAEVEAAVGSIGGIGEVYVYDTALRLGANLGLAPTRVYLHAGTAKGARALGLKGKTVEIANLPPELQELDALHLEDFLCVDKKILKRHAVRAARRPRGRGVHLVPSDTPMIPTHPSIVYARPYEDAETLFGKEMSARELIERVRSFSWAGSFLQLACLAAVVANEPRGLLSERVRHLTVDPITRLTGNATCTELLARGRAAVQSRRDEIILAHEEVISFLQHLVILEGAESGDAPGAPEVAFWLAGANGHLARWSAEERESVSDDEALAAELVRISRFNNRPDLLRSLVRTHCIFGRKPSTGTLAAAERWGALAATAYPNGFDESFESGLGLVAMLAQRWGTDDDPSTYPVMNLDRFLGQSRLTPKAFVEALDGYIANRDELRTAIRERTRQDGLPHSPTALFHSPLVELEPGVLVAASPWAVTGLLRTGVWARFLRAAKSLDRRRGADEWLRGFGYMFEDWCRYVATEAEGSPLRRATILLPSSPGAVDEVEDVVIVDDGIAVFCSAKSRLVEAKVAREAVSASSIVDWMEKFFFEAKGDEYRGGVVRQLSARVDKLRAGEFENSGLSRDTRVIPVVVTYDSLGESDVLYRRVEEGCVRHGLLQQTGVGPLALARIEEFEQLLSRVARGKPVSQLLLGREGLHRHRRLDQVLYEAEPPAPPRLPFFEREAMLLTQRMVSRVTGKQA